MNHLSTINVWGILFPDPEYYCSSNNENPDLVKLTNPVYRDDWEQVVSSSTGEIFPVYQRTIGEYDCYETKTISEQELLAKFKSRPKIRIELIEADILRNKKKERDAEIIHYKGYRTDWGIADLAQKIDLPKLKYKIPENRDELD